MKEYTQLGDEILYKNININEAKRTVVKDVYFLVVNCYSKVENGRNVLYGDIIATSTTDPFLADLGEKYTDCDIGTLTGNDLFQELDKRGRYV